MTAKGAACLSKTALQIFEGGKRLAFQRAKEPHRASLTCKYSPDCFRCPLADCAVESEKAIVTNII